MINRFTGEYAYLSNFYINAVLLDNRIYPSVENAYQAAKTFKDRSNFYHCDPGFAKRLGSRVVLRANWEQVKIEVMRSLIKQKFQPNCYLAGKLLSTENKELVEGNSWNDTFWGVCRGVGENNLGKLLMEQRAYLKGLP